MIECCSIPDENTDTGDQFEAEAVTTRSQADTPIPQSDNSATQSTSLVSQISQESNQSLNVTDDHFNNDGFKSMQVRLSTVKQGGNTFAGIHLLID